MRVIVTSNYSETGEVAGGMIAKGRIGRFWRGTLWRTPRWRRILPTGAIFAKG